MTAVITCPKCNSSLVAPPELTGKVVACPRCQQAIQLVAEVVPTGVPPSPFNSAVAPPMPSPQPVTSWTPANLSSPSSSAKVGSRNRTRSKPFPYAALASWVALLSCVIIPAIILLYLRANHRPEPAVADNRQALPPPAQRPADASRNVPAATNSAALPPAGQGRPPLNSPANTPASATPRPAAPTSASSPSSMPAVTPLPAGAPNPVPQQPPPQPASIFARTGEYWQLPALLSSAAEPLGQLAAPPTEPLELFVKFQAADIPEEAAYFAKSAPESHRWTLSYLADLQNDASQIPLAELRLDGVQFTFAWLSSPAEIGMRRQLANCLLEIKHDKEQRQLSFRAPNELPICKLDLNLDVQKFDLPLADPPKASSLRLEIGKLIGFPTGASVSPQALELGQDAKIQFADPAGAEIEIRFRRLPGSEFVVQLEPVFWENRSKTFEMTLPRLDAMEKGASTALREAEQELSQRTSELSRQQSALRALQNSPPKNPILVPAWKGDVGSAEAQIKRTVGRIAALQKQIPTHRARLEATPAMRQFLTSLDGQASIPFRLVAKAGDRDMLLVSAGSK
jgi:hypothetical protein